MQDNDLTFSYRDEYERIGAANKIVILLEKDLPISPIVIDGEYGQGKTEFCHKLINLLKEKGWKCIYIDSFKNDHSNDPLLTIFSSIISKIDDPEAKRDLKKALLPVLSFGLKTLGKAGISWVLKKEPDMLIDEFEKIVNETGDAALNAISSQLISDQQKEEGDLLALKKALKLATRKNKLVVFIDELDRCRPSFAVETLEKIKHVFDIRSITFVIVTNLQQLQASINNIYGDQIDTGEYLDKFINLTIRLNQKSGFKEHLVLNRIKHFESLVRQSEDISLKLDEGDSLNELIKCFIGIHGLSLRQVERLVTKIRVFEAISRVPLQKMKIESGLISIALIFLDYLFPDIANKIENGSFTGAEINKLLLKGKVRHAQDWSILDYYSAMNNVMDLGKNQVLEPERERHFAQIKQAFLYHGHLGLGQTIKDTHMELIRDIRLN